MPGHGRAPKDPGQRRRYNQPARGEWVDLEPLKEPILPGFSRLMQVPAYMWNGWRASPVTSQYGPEDIVAITYLANHFWDLSEPTRVRLMDGLGLTPKGKRDLRWRTPNEVKTIKANERKQAEVRQLRIVADKEK